MRVRDLSRSVDDWRAGYFHRFLFASSRAEASDLKSKYKTLHKISDLGMWHDVCYKSDLANCDQSF